MTKHRSNNLSTDGMMHEGAVFDVDLSAFTAYPNGDVLPSIWVTRSIQDERGVSIGRVRSLLYPNPNYDDADGEDALYYGGCYYDEAMSYTDQLYHDQRIDCFRAAELFYRHAAAKGNAVANLCLGYVYSYDRCEGHYWVSNTACDAAPNASEAARSHPYPRQRRAFECLLAAAQASIPEACYKLGDMYKHGTGCDAQATEAFRWYVRASELAAHERPVILGSIALRLADCYENGFGCSQDFNRALAWYRKAVTGLEVAVDAGEVWYEKALASARSGEKRCKQEV